ncbi:MAG: dTDP-glucose 4,6-dehydratase [Planctomycetes bacterium]|nr:dTDP-glucose 4,6-dehydratase [Planctomycetota bacterium]
MKLLVTGGCGFIGSDFIRWILDARPDLQVTNLDSLTYAGNLENLAECEANPRYRFVRGSVADADAVDAAVREAEGIVHFAAESHVDRSLYGPVDFARTNVEGTVVLLEAARRHRLRRFVLVSTDEVYGSLAEEGTFTESSPLAPSSAYSATKAAGDLMALAYRRTFGLDVVITRGSNTYGPHQYPEKFIPLFITNALEDRPCPLYGDGRNVRDWLYVRDHTRGIWAAFEGGRSGEVYNLGGGNERRNVDVARAVLRAVGRPESLIQHVADRPGHDRRYALDTRKARAELGWAPDIPFERGLSDTVAWYRDHAEWVRRVKSGDYRTYYERHYGIGNRLEPGARSLEPEIQDEKPTSST